MVDASVAACIDAGKCVIMSKGAWYILIGIFSMAGLLLVLLFFIAFFTPGFSFLKAKMTKSMLVYIVNRSQIGRFVIGKHKTEGILDIRKIGPVIMTENSHTREHKSGLPLFFVFGEFAGTLPLKWVYVLNKLREKAQKENKPIVNIDGLAKEVGLKFNEETKVWESA